MSSLLRSVGLLCARLHSAAPGALRSYATNYKPKDKQQFADALNKLSNKDMILVSISFINSNRALIWMPCSKGHPDQCRSSIQVQIYSDNG